MPASHWLSKKGRAYEEPIVCKAPRARNAKALGQRSAEGAEYI